MLAAQFIINEFLAANATGLADGFGERSDWIEIRNTGDAAGDLVGYHLTDSAGDLDMWTFPPATVVQPGGYLIVFASSSFIYVAVADLLPQLQRRLPMRETLGQIAWIVVGLAAVYLARLYLHAPH